LDVAAVSTAGPLEVLEVADVAAVLRRFPGRLVANEITVRSVTASVRGADGTAVEDCVWDTVPVEVLTAAAPWRTFRWYLGQRHYSGAFWSSTQRDHVIYESRLELAVLLSADFDASVSAIVAQPFLLRAEVGGVTRRHVPDYLLMTDAGPVVVDVKPRHRLDRPELAATFGWTREVVCRRGWRFEVRSEPPQARIENLRFLAGYRRDWLFDPVLLAAVCGADLHGASLGEAFGCLPEWPTPLVRSAVFHLIWFGHFAVDLDHQLRASHTLTVVTTR
jgi:hypothetical protein